MQVEQYDILGHHEGKPAVPIPTGRVRFHLDDITHVTIEPHPNHEGELRMYIGGCSSRTCFAVMAEACNALRIGAVDSLDDLAR